VIAEWFTNASTPLPAAESTIDGDLANDPQWGWKFTKAGAAAATTAVGAIQGPRRARIHRAASRRKVRLRPLGRIHEHRLEARHRAEARRVAHRPGEADRGGDQDAMMREKTRRVGSHRPPAAQPSRTPCATPSPPTASTPASTPQNESTIIETFQKPHRGAKAGGVGPQPSSPASALSTSDDVVCESDAQKPPAGDGRNFLPHRTPVGPDLLTATSALLRPASTT
jgi:hypothetical protein